MKQERLSRTLARYGTQLQQWPWWMRCQARRSWLGSPAARAQLKHELGQERALQRLLQPDPAAPPLPDALLRRLDTIPAQFDQIGASGARPRLAQRDDRRLIGFGLGWATACAALGLAIGADGWIAPPMDSSLLADYAWGVDAPLALLGDGAES